jgi:hypothetical protein
MVMALALLPIVIISFWEKFKSQHFVGLSPVVGIIIAARA